MSHRREQEEAHGVLSAWGAEGRSARLLIGFFVEPVQRIVGDLREIELLSVCEEISQDHATKKRLYC